MADNFNGSQLYAGNKTANNSGTITNSNHIFLDTKESFEDTLLQINKIDRHRGLFITYVRLDKVNTLYYNSSDTSDNSWINEDNWIQVI